MEIKDINELRALHKLLVSIKTSEDLASFEIDLFASSPFINDILKRLREEYISILRKKDGDNRIDEWLNATKFTMDSEMGKAVQSRIQNWKASTVASLKKAPESRVVAIAKSYVEPFDYESKEMDKLVEFIARRLNSNE